MRIVTSCSRRFTRNYDYSLPPETLPRIPGGKVVQNKQGERRGQVEKRGGPYRSSVHHSRKLRPSPPSVTFY